MTDPSLLDYLAARLRFWRRTDAGLPTLRELWSEAPAGEAAVAGAGTDVETAPPTEPSHPRQRRWRPPRLRIDGPLPAAVASALALALAGQVMLTLEPPAAAAGVVLLLGAAGAALFAVRRGEVTFSPAPAVDGTAAAETRLRIGVAVAAAAAAGAAGAAAADNHVGWPGVVAWLAAVALATAALAPAGLVATWIERLVDVAARRVRRRRPDRGVVTALVLMAVAVALRTQHLASIPREMVSAHAELMLAVIRAGAADRPIVFPWGVGGLEPIPVYLGALLAPLAGGLSFAALKLATLVAGLVTLPLIYLIGREVGGRGVALGAAALASVAAWPDLVSRTGLADAWLPPFAAAAVLLVLRAVRTGRRMDFAAAGVAIGLGMQATSLARSLPATALAMIAFAALGAGVRQRRRLAAGVVTVLVFALLAGLPTLVASAATVAHPAPGWWLGAADGDSGRPATTDLGERFVRVVAQPLLSDGSSWHHGGTERPGLDRVCGSLLVLGIALAAIGALRRRAPAAGLVAIALPVLLMPAWLAPLAPELAPSPLRAGGAMAAVFVLAGLGLASVWKAVASSSATPIGRVVATAVVAALLALSASAGRGVVQGPFAERWSASAWNASELGAAVRAAVELGVPVERVGVVPFPHWVDTRLVAAEAGFPGADLAVVPPTSSAPSDGRGPWLFLLHPNDSRNLSTLRARLPRASIVPRPSRIEGKGFVIVIELASGGGGVR